MYTRKDILNFVGKSKMAVRYYLEKNKIQPIHVAYGVCGAPTYYYSEIVFQKAILDLNKRKLKYRRQVIIDRITKEIFCDLDLNVNIPSKLNYLTLEQL